MFIKKSLATAVALIISSSTFAAPAPLIMGYWGNWHMYDSDKNGRSNDEYQIPGSKNKDNGQTVVNPVFQKQLQNLNAVSYAFLEVYPDAGMYRDVPQKPVDQTKVGTVFLSDPWSDLMNNDTNVQFCKSHHITCYAAYEIQQDPNTARAPVDENQPWNYFSMGNFDAFTKLSTQRYISIGGWYHQDSFEKGAFVNPTAFTQSIIDLINKAKASGGDINGIDLDYEPPAGYTAENAAKLVNLVTQLRQGLDANGLQNVKISVPVFANPTKLAAFDGNQSNIRALAAVVDYIGIMGYDFHGAWDNPTMTGLQSNLYQDPSNPNANDFSVQKAVDALVAAGAPKAKLVLGVPSYGRVVGGVSSTANNGLYQTFDPNNIPVSDMDKGQVSYYKLIGQWINKGFTDHSILFNNKVSGVWAYNPTNQQFLSYDNTALVDTKADYIVNNGLGGMMMWELIGDVSPDDKNNASLLKHIHDGLMK